VQTSRTEQSAHLCLAITGNRPFRPGNARWGKGLCKQWLLAYSLGMWCSLCPSLRNSSFPS